MESINLSNLTVGEDGRVSLGGASSGIDIEEIVTSIIAAKRIPVDRIENRILDNEDQIEALADMRALLITLRQSLSSLRGAITLGNTGDVFSAKQVFATTSRTDGSLPSAAGNLIAVTPTNAAAAGTHTIEVLRTAAAHKVASKTFASETAALSLSGTFDVTGKGGSATITVTSATTLQDIRDRINNANTGVNATGVGASIVQTSSTEFILVLTAADTGVDMVITDTGSVLSGLGISTTNGAGSYRNGLAAVDSKIEATNDGFKQISFDGTQADNSFLISYSQSSKIMTLTRGDGTTDTATLSSTAIATGKTETATFSTFGVDIVLDDKFVKTTDITVEADVFNQTGNAGTIDVATIKIIDSVGDVSGIASTTLTFDVSTPASATISVGSFTSGTFDATATGVHDVTLTDGAKSLTVRFDITLALDNVGPPTITLNELKNLVSSTGTAFDNELQTSQTARFTADGLLDADRFESHFITSSTSTLTTLAPKAGDGSFDITVGSDSVTVNYLGADTLSGLVTKINNAITSASNGVTTAGTAASLMTDGDGVRLVITNTNAAAITLTDTNGLIAELGIDNNLVIERNSNTVGDLFDGITLTLFQAEELTTIKIEIERDLTSAKSAIEATVNAFNALKSFLNEHSKTNSTTGAAADDGGVLFGSSAIFGVTSSLSSVFSKATAGVDDAFKVLAQVGITFVDNASVADPLLNNTLEIDEAKLDKALLNNPDDVRRLFAFDFSASDPRVSLLGFSSNTSFNTTGYKLNLNFDDRFHTKIFTNAGTFTELDAITSGPAADGISAIAFDPSIASGTAYRYSYNSGTEGLTLTNLTTGGSETVTLTSILDAIGDGGDLGATETATINFIDSKVTFTLTGADSPTTNFKRGTDIITTGAIDVSGQIVAGSNGFAPATATVTYDNNGGVTNAVVTALKAVVTTNGISYDAATGKLTIAIESDGANVTKIRNGTGSGVSFQIDGTGGFSENGTSLVDLEDGLAHTIEIKVGGQVIGTASIGIATSTGAGTDAAIVVDIGRGLFSETSNTTDATAPMENYLALSDGSFQIRDSSNTLLGTVTYVKGDSLQALSTSISSNVANVTAVVITSGSTFKLEVLHANRDTLTFEADSGGLIALLSITNGGDGVYSANIDGATGGGDNLTVTANGRTMTVTSLSNGEGLKIFYDGSVDLDAIQLDFTSGFGSRLYFAIDTMLAAGTGLVDSNVATLTKQNTVHQDRIDDILARLELTRATLTQQYINMEVALAKAKNLQDSLTQSFNAMFASQSN